MCLLPSLLSREINKVFFGFLGGKYTKDDFKAYEKEVGYKWALKDKVKPKPEYP